MKVCEGLKGKGLGSVRNLNRRISFNTSSVGLSKGKINPNEEGGRNIKRDQTLKKKVRVNV